jgi:hypothetical protein
MDPSSIRLSISVAPPHLFPRLGRPALVVRRRTVPVRLPTLAALALALLSPPATATETATPPVTEDPATKHRDGSSRLATEQDELTADVQQLVLEQTVDKVIELLEEVGDAMDDATDRLEEHDTGGATIAAQTDVIEKIYEAAKERQKQSSGSEQSPGGAMMDMLERMMGKTPDVDKQSKDGKPADQGGEGVTGESDAANDRTGGDAAGKVEERRVPRASGTAGRPVPAEFRDALDAFNKGSEQLAK